MLTEDYCTMYPSIHLCRWGHFDIVKVLITEGHSDAKIRDCSGYPPLHEACW